MLPDYRFYVGKGLNQILHSAKGTTWSNHKYIKKVDGTYYYPDDLNKEKEQKNEYDQKDEYGVNLNEVEQGVYDYVFNNLKDIDPSSVSPETWQNFIKEYIKFVGGDPNDIPDSEIQKIQENVSEHYSEKQNSELNEEDIDKLASEAIKGNFGNGRTRKELLGDNYERVQKRINEIMKNKKQKIKDKSNNKLIDLGNQMINKFSKVKIKR